MNETTPTRKCPFAAPITTGRAACCNAREVVRRGGSEFDFEDAEAHARCAAVFAGLKSTGLAGFGVEDDLTQMPHSVLVKIQTGGLVGLRRLLEPNADAAAPVADVASLAAHGQRIFGGVEHIPFSELADDMLSCKLERRVRRRGG